MAIVSKKTKNRQIVGFFAYRPTFLCRDYVPVASDPWSAPTAIHFAPDAPASTPRLSGSSPLPFPLRLKRPSSDWPATLYATYSLLILLFDICRRDRKDASRLKMCLYPIQKPAPIRERVGFDLFKRSLFVWLLWPVQRRLFRR
jgi:hypothetical protein